MRMRRLVVGRTRSGGLAGGRRVTLPVGIGLRMARLLLVLALVGALSGCEVWWSTARFDNGGTGFNPAEHTIGLGDVAALTPRASAVVGTTDSKRVPPIVANGFVYAAAHGVLKAFSADRSAGCTGEPLVCVPVWWADLDGSYVYAPPTVAAGRVYLSTYDAGLLVFDAAGRANCTGVPAVCVPLWSSPHAYATPPTVANGYVYQVDQGLMVVLDAEGERGCAGVPKVCMPLWRTPWRAIGSLSAPTVSSSFVYLSDNDGGLYAYTAHPTDRCTGPEVTCPPVWTPQLEGCCTSSSPYMAWTAPVLADGRVLMYRVVPVRTWPYLPYLQLASFDAAGVDGCRANSNVNLGASTLCDPQWTTTLPGSPENSQLAAAYGSVFAITRTRTGTTTDTVTAYRTDGVGCAGVPMTCPARWQSTPTLAGDFSYPVVANGVLYQDSPDGIAAFDARATTCPDGGCRPAAVLDAPAGTRNLAVVDGRIHVLSAVPADTSGRVFETTLSVHT